MTEIPVRHAFQSAVSDASTSGIIKPQAHWNANHVMLINPQRLAGRDQSGQGAAEEIGLQSGQLEFDGSQTIRLVDTAVTPGAYLNANITIDAKGRITAATSSPATTGANAAADYFLGTLDPGLTFARLPTATATVSWDVATANQFKANVIDASITFAKFQNVTSDRLIGRDTAASGSVEEISIGGGLEFTGSAGIQIADAGVTYAKIANGTGLSVVGRSANSAGVNADIVGVDGNVLRVSGTALGFGTIVAAGIASDAVTTVKILDANVTYAKIQNVAGLSVVGRSANSSGVAAAITGVDGNVLRVSGTTLGFGTIVAAGIASDAVTTVKILDANVTFAKIVNSASSGLSVVGRSTNSAGVFAEINAASDFQVLRRSGTAVGFGAIDLSQAAATTGDLPFSALAQGSARSVLGVTGNGTADVASIQGTADQVLVVNGAGTALTFATVATAGITADAVTFAKMQNITSDRLIGRDTASSGDPEEISLGASLEWSGSQSIQRAALSGAITASANSNTTTATVDIVVVIGDGVNVISTGVKGYLPIDFAGSVTQWTLVADASGAIVIDVWKDTYANFPPVVGDSIAGSEKPTLSGPAQKNQDTSLSTWTSSGAFSAGDVFGFNVDSASTVKQVTLTLKCTKTS